MFGTCLKNVISALQKVFFFAEKAGLLLSASKHRNSKDNIIIWGQSINHKVHFKSVCVFSSALYVEVS